MAEVGDKFIIEIDEVFKAKGIYKAYGGEENDYEEKLYRIKGFKTLVFNEYGLAALEKYGPPEEDKASPINVGDEVEDRSGARWFVTFVKRMNGGVYAVSGVGLDGCLHSTSTIEAKRTGHRNRHIVDALNWKVPLSEYHEIQHPQEINF